MGIMDRASLRISEKLGDRLNKSDDEKAVLNYGLFTILHTTLAIIGTIFVGILTNMVFEIMVISISAAFMKRYSGGVHSSTPERCLITGIIFSFILSLLCKHVIYRLSNTIILIMLIVGLVGAYYILYKRCPVGSKNKPLRKEETRNKLRKKAFKLISIYSLIIAISYMINININLYWMKVFMISIFLGIMLQMFSLTQSAKVVLNVLEKIYDIVKIN